MREPSDFDWKKTDNKNTTKTENYDNVGKEINKLCEELFKESKEFNPEIFCNDLEKYLGKYNRLAYNKITEYIYRALYKEDTSGTILTNLDNLCEYINNLEEKEKIKDVVFKLWDHCNLALIQINELKKKDSDYKRIVDERIKVESNEIAREMNSQFISLIAVFTALAFVIFGGISSLSNIITEIKNVSIIKLGIGSCIWSFCFINLIFFFMFYVSRIAKINIADMENKNANLIQKYPLIVLANTFIVSLLVFFLCLYCVNANKMIFFIKHSCAASIILFLAVAFIIILWINYIIKKYKQNI